MTSPGRTRSVLAWTLTLGVALAWVVLPAAAGAADTYAPVALGGSGASGADPVVLDWARAMFESDGRPSVDYVPAGTADARAAFVAGDNDFVLSAVGFTDAQKAELQKSGRGLIEAPVQGTAVAMLGWMPPGTLFTVPEDCEENCIELRQYLDGPLRLTPSVLASAMYETGNNWSESEFWDTLDLAGKFLVIPTRGLRPLVRGDADATNQFLDQYLAATATQQRLDHLKSSAGSDPDAVPSETWPFQLTFSRLGEDAMVGQLANGLDPGSSDGSAVAPGALGNVGTFSANLAVLAQAAKPEAERVRMFVAQLRNGAGEWVAPTPASITAALAAGGGRPLAGATAQDAVPGAYPMSYVNRLYAPAAGLTPGQANALATAIRWQVTAGQDRADDLGDGTLPPALVDEALTAADRIVESNCRAARSTVYTDTDPGRFAPKGTLRGIGRMKHCKEPVVPVDDTTTTVVGGDVPTDVLAEGYATYDDSALGYDGLTDDGGFSPLDASSDLSSGLDTSGGATSGPGSGSRADGQEIAASIPGLPLPIPGKDWKAMDRAVTLILGAMMYLGFRAFLRRRRVIA